MTTPLESEVPYETQADAHGNRLCGAAALVMACRSLGVTASQAEVWPGVRGADAGGELRAKTHLLAREAQARGLTAVVLQASRPWEALKRCVDHRARAILNHRVSAGMPHGHYSAMVRLEPEFITYHDPSAGPSRRLPWRDFLVLWNPMPGGPGGAGITGQVLVAVGRDEPGPAHCARCGTDVPRAVTCPACARLVQLRPTRVVGCTSPGCSERTWRTLFCPACDAPVLGGDGSRGGAPPTTGAPAAAASPVNPHDFPVTGSITDQVAFAFRLVNARLNARLAAETDPSARAALTARGADIAALEKKGMAGLAALVRPPVIDPVPEPPVLDGDSLARQLLAEFGLTPPPPPPAPPPADAYDTLDESTPASAPPVRPTAGHIDVRQAPPKPPAKTNAPPPPDEASPDAFATLEE